MLNTNLALLGRLGVLSETPLSFCPALAENSEIPPGTCPSLLWESQIQVGASMGKTKKTPQNSIEVVLELYCAHAWMPAHAKTHGYDHLNATHRTGKV